MLLLPRCKVDLLKTGNVVSQVITVGLETAVEHLEMLTGKGFGHFLDVVEVAVDVLGQAVGVIAVVPPGRYALLDRDAVLGVGVLELVVDVFELFFGRLEGVTSEPLVLGSIRRILRFLHFKNRLLLLDCQIRDRKRLHNRTPLLPDRHLMLLKHPILPILPRQQHSFMFVILCKVGQFALQNDDPVLLFGRDLRDELVDEIEHRGVEVGTEGDGGVGADGSGEEVELFLENGVGGLLGEVVDDDVDELVGSHLAVFDHVEEASPYEGATENVFDVVEMGCEEVEGLLVDDVLGKCVVLEVE